MDKEEQVLQREFICPECGKSLAWTMVTASVYCPGCDLWVNQENSLGSNQAYLPIDSEQTVLFQKWGLKMNNLWEQAAALQGEMVARRRDLHKHPESAWTEFRTASMVVRELQALGYNVAYGAAVVHKESMMGVPSAAQLKACEERALAEGADPEIIAAMEGGLTGVVAVLETGKPGKTVAFRFDMDCNDVEEAKDPAHRPAVEGFASIHTNAMHACGHDGHTTIGLALAKLLAANKESLAGTVKLIFQPAEERYHGAQSIVDNGHVDDVEYFLSVHMALTGEGYPLPSNSICCGCKDFLSDDQLDITFHGREAHPCGASQEGKNALLAACTAAINIHAIAPHEAGLCRVNVGILNAGEAVNTIAGNAFMSVEYRGSTQEVAQYARKRIIDILDGAVKAYDMEYTMNDLGEIPASASDDAIMEIVQRAAEKTPWFSKIYFEGSVGGTDDVSVMINKVHENGGLATYIGIGCDTTQPLHNAEFDLDEDSIPAAIEMLIHAVEEINRR